MKKTTQLWTVEKLQEQFARIDFPEYQREPNVWSRGAKQRLVDSMLRQFDIASLYFYRNEDGSIDCIDGQQRIGAIMSFLKENPDDNDNGFPFRIMNEVYVDDVVPFADLANMEFSEIVQRAGAGDDVARQLVEQFKGYQLTVVELSGSRRPDEFNLQFTRLNLGAILNSGEKLHAMVGDMRDACFGEGGIGQHPFFEGTAIQTRRYAKEQVAAQILSQAFSLQEPDGGFTRTRHYDLQKFFKTYSTLDGTQRGLIEEIRSTLDSLANTLQDVGILRNRAITVSTVLLAWKLRLADNDEMSGEFADFIDQFLCRLDWQVKKGLHADAEYHYLIDFQRYVTQASVEKPAVQRRAETLQTEFDRWLSEHYLRGDEEYKTRTDKDPAEECRG